MGFSVAGNVRVGNALGAGDTEQARLSAKLTIFCAGLYLHKYYVFAIRAHDAKMLH